MDTLREDENLSNLPTLQDITGERPTCQCCHKPLKPFTSFFWLAGEFQRPPTLEEIQRVRDDIMSRGSSTVLLPNPSKDQYLPGRVFRVKTKASNLREGEKETKVSYWMGFYEGYGLGKDGLRLFCSTNCAVRFAAACYDAGMRIVRKEGEK